MNSNLVVVRVIVEIIMNIFICIDSYAIGHNPKKVWVNSVKVAIPICGVHQSLPPYIINSYIGGNDCVL
jgi:hypothetical protein